MLQHKANVDLAVDDGATPLLKASENGHGELVEMMLQHKANVDLATNTGSTLL